MRGSVRTRRDPATPHVVVVVTGALAGRAVPRWARVIDGAVEACPRRLVVDLVRCPRIDAAAIVYLLQAHRRLLCADGDLILRGPVREVRRMLALGRVDHVLQVECVASDM